MTHLRFKRGETVVVDNYLGAGRIDIGMIGVITRVHKDEDFHYTVRLKNGNGEEWFYDSELRPLTKLEKALT